MSYESGICFHCGKKKEEHLGGPLQYCRYKAVRVHGTNYTHFEDSGLKKVRDNAENVLRAAQEVVRLPRSSFAFQEAVAALEAAISGSIGEKEGERQN